ncbi:MAG: hypothetical protein F4206_16915 [Gammaproteobacteria bacterium]|nr:hypothetical protein [Gammaproteobacteria bacterium]MYG68390.1 hypothetical protein [Gammaproteobacteria bacterium]
MSLTANDRIDGKRLALIYGSEPLALSTAGSRWERSREILRHLSRTRSKAALVTRSADGQEESWWAADEAGVSFAAAIDAWLEIRMADSGSNPLPERLHVVIPLDTRIYFALVDQGMVREEAVLAPEPALERLEEAEGHDVIYGFAAGRCTEPLERFLELEAPPFDLLRFRFGGPAFAMLRRGLFHPRHAAVFALVIFLAVGAQFSVGLLKTGLPALARWFGAPEAVLVDTQDTVAAPIRTMVPHVRWSAADELRDLARHVVLAERLHGDGLTEMILEDATVTAHGVRPDGGYPEAVRAAADSLDTVWALDSNGWRLTVPLGGPNERKHARRETVATGPVLEFLLRHPMRLRLVAGPDRRDSVQPGGNVRILPVTRTAFRADLEQITAQDLVDAAAGLDNMPVSLAGATCEFRDWQLQNCSLRFESETFDPS